MKINKTKFFVALFFVGVFLLFFLTPMDPDLGWHLRCGEMFWQTGSFCSTNTFSVLLSGYSWPNHAWGFQAVLYPIYKFGGFFGLSLLNSIIVTLSFLLLYFSIRDKNKKWEKILIIGISIIFSFQVFSLGIRSQILGILFFAIEIFILLRSKEKEKLLYFIPLLFLVWANFHGSVIVGIVLFGFFLFRRIVFENKDWVKNGSLFLFSIISPIINPFGLQIYTDAWKHFAVVDLSKLIAEWTPPGFLVSFFIVIFAILFLYLCFRKKSLGNAFYSFLILGFLYPALKARRNVILYFLILFFVYFSFHNEDPFNGFFEHKKLRNLFFVLVSLFFVTVLIFSIPANLKSDFNYNSWCQKSVERNLNYPCSAAQFLENKISGNIFNAYEWGGFLIWKTPQDKIFVDGRMPTWNTPSKKSPYTIYLETIQTQPGWQETLGKYNFTYLVIGSGTFMDLELQRNHSSEGFKEIYRDSISAIWEKN